MRVFLYACSCVCLYDCVFVCLSVLCFQVFVRVGLYVGMSLRVYVCIVVRL